MPGHRVSPRRARVATGDATDRGGSAVLRRPLRRCSSPADDCERGLRWPDLPLET